MKRLKVARSIIAADAFGELLSDAYSLPEPLNCKLISKMLRTQDNDHYLVRSGSNKYVARIYQVGEHLNRERSEYLYELRWLDYLNLQGLPVSFPLPMENGELLGDIDAPEGRRYFALFTFAEGKPMVPTNQDQLFELGSNMAQIHVASNNFESSHSRQPMDLQYLADRPVERLRQRWEAKQDDRLAILLASAAEARQEIQMLLDNEESTEDSWGPIGGDFHPGNVHFNERNEPHFFNFDLCGPGWRAYDIATFLLNSGIMQKSSQLAEAFFAGYYSVRPLSNNEHRAVSPFLALRRVWLTGLFAAVDGVAGYTFIAPAYIDGT